MFVRKKKNKSGSVSIQIIDKTDGKYRVISTVGSSKDENKINHLINNAIQLIPKLHNQTTIEFGYSRRDRAILDFVKYNKSLRIYTVGPELVLGKIFNTLGFNTIKENLFKQIVVARLVYPTSKLKTVDYIMRHRGVKISVQRVYDFLDRLNKKHKETVERISYENTKRILKTISVVFYDMTTLYFEAEDEDDLRKIGFSKDGKFQKPQIMLGLLVGENGYPIGYDIFEGNIFEGYTLLPTLKKIQKKYNFTQPIVVADAGLLSKDNLKKLGEQEYKFILGGRIKNENDKVKSEILKKSQNMKDGDSFTIEKEDGIRLIVTYSDKRAKKDEYNRKKGLRKLEIRVKTGKLTKNSINNRGYNKFLTLSGNIKVSINEEKIKVDKLWDGLKGYITNTKLTSDKVVGHYSHLWQIEKAFRISKTDLRIRPVYHYKKRRIEAHICICFVAYVIWKELERLLTKNEIDLSPQKAIELLKTIYEARFVLPDSNKEERALINLSVVQKLLLKVSGS